MGCSLATSMVAAIKTFKRSINPDLLFVEPAEMVVSKEMKNVVAMGLRDLRYEVGPLITLFDSKKFPVNWLNRRALLLGQASGADMLLLSKADLVDQTEIDDILLQLSAWNFSTYPLSTIHNLGLNEVTEAIHGNRSK